LPRHRAGLHATAKDAFVALNAKLSVNAQAIAVLLLPGHSSMPRDLSNMFVALEERGKPGAEQFSLRLPPFC